MSNGYHHDSNGPNGYHDSNGSNGYHDSNGSNGYHDSNGSTGYSENGSNGYPDSNGVNGYYDSSGSSDPNGPDCIPFAGSSLTHDGTLSASDGTFGSLSPTTPPIQNYQGPNEERTAEGVTIKVESDIDAMTLIDAPQQDESWAPFIPDLDLPEVYSTADKDATLSIPTFDWDPMSLFGEQQMAGRVQGEFPWYLSGSA
jgi:hypothetical protein